MRGGAAFILRLSARMEKPLLRRGLPMPARLCARSALARCILLAPERGCLRPKLRLPAPWPRSRGALAGRISFSWPSSASSPIPLSRRRPQGLSKPARRRQLLQRERETAMMIWPAKAAPLIEAIGVERSAECAAIHAASFACPWDETEFEQLFISPGAFADGAIAAKDGQLLGFVLSRIAADEAEILTL